MLNLEFFNRPTNITAKVICDSICEQGVRLTTLEIEYPRFIHGEFMTHRSLSKNSSSSRAIPIQKMLDQIESNMAIPIYWGKNKSGMQAVEEVDELSKSNAEILWRGCFWKAKDTASWMSEDGLHKQVPNRLTEPFQMMKVVVTGTDWDNFFNLRIHPDAQPEICMLAYKIYKAMEESYPVKLKAEDWHLPYVGFEYWGDEPKYFITKVSNEDDQSYGMKYEEYLSLEDAIKISASCCAQVSYRNTDMSLDKADKIFNMLIKSDVLHASCFEHLATPVKSEQEIENSDYLTIGFVNRAGDPKTWEYGITHQNKSGQLFSGNLRGWISYRQQLRNNTCWKFDFEERMKLFK